MERTQFTKQNFSIDGFVESCRAYLEQREALPILAAESAARFPHDRVAIEAVLFPSLMEEVVGNPEKYKRDLNDLLTFGYMGSSRGRVNGVVAIPGRDKNLRGAVKRFRHPRYEEFAQAVGVDPTSEQLVGVKVVTHRKNGQRMIGVFDRDNGTVILYDVRAYRK